MTRKIDYRRLGRLRQGQGEIANHIIDEFAAGRMSRRDFIRRASVVGIITPTGAINPVVLFDQGGLDMLGQTGEYLVQSGQTLNLKPQLATSWSPNSNASVWTFKIRQGV